MDKIVISKVNGKLWDLERPLEGNASVEFLHFEDKDGKYMNAFVFFITVRHLLSAFILEIKTVFT